MRIIQESETLYRLTRFGVVNCFLVREASGFTLVDTGLPGSAGRILQAANALGAPIETIALTHAHFDHVGSVESLVEALPGVELAIGVRENRLLRGDFSLDPGERGKPIVGFQRVSPHATQLLQEGDRVGTLRVVNSPGHTPGHVSFLDERDNSLLAGDAFTTQMGLLAAGVFRLTFPFPALFSWNAERAAASAAKLAGLKPTRLAVGHGATLRDPVARMERAAEVALRAHGRAA